MQKIKNSNKLLSCLGALAIVAMAVPQAFAGADAGSIQRDIENLNSPNLPPTVAPEDSDQAAPAADSNVAFKVTAFHFTGASFFTDEQLQAQVASYIGQTIDYTALTQITKKISRYYQANGRLARVFLPPQDVENGVVNIEIVEAKLGNVNTNSSEAKRIAPDFAAKMLGNVQKEGEPLNSEALERALLLINDTPGVSAQATLSPGAQSAETDVTLNLADRPLFNGRVWADNYGSRFLGKARLNAQFNLNDLSGFGDQLSVNAIASRGLEFVQGNYDFPIGYAGTRINIGGAVSNYEISGGGLSDLDAEGESYSYRLGLRHPFIRSRLANLSVQANAESFNSEDDVLGLETSDDRYNAFTLGLRGDHTDYFGGGGTFWGGVSVTAGDLDLRNQGDLAADRLSARSDGGYTKLNFHVGRYQVLADKWTGKALLSAQWASDNLGGYEKFSLGGPYGVAGFTVGEAAADQGWMLNLEGKYAITPQWNASLLADAGGVCLHEDTWAGWNAGNPRLKNCYQLASAGFGVGFSNQYVDAKLGYSRRITGNRGLDSNREDVEGENSKNQLWLQIGTNF